MMNRRTSTRRRRRWLPSTNRRFSVSHSDVELQEERLERRVLTVCVLGARGVGKWTFASQFALNHLPNQSTHEKPAKGKRVYHVTAVGMNIIYDIRILVCPAFAVFPESSVHEWNYFQGLSIREADVFFFIYDIGRAETFDYVRRLRLTFMRNVACEKPTCVIVGNKTDVENRAIHREDIVQLVKKHWRWNYAECSAGANWHISQVMRDAVKVWEDESLTKSARYAKQLRQNNCTIS